MKSLPFSSMLPVHELFPVNQGFNSHGITGDGNGNLYYGTYNRTYVGKYDTKTKTWSKISEVLIPGMVMSITQASEVPAATSIRALS